MNFRQARESGSRSESGTIKLSKEKDDLFRRTGTRQLSVLLLYFVLPQFDGQIDILDLRNFIPDSVD